MDDNFDKEQAADLRESLAMLALLEISSRDVKAGRVRDAEEVFEELQAMIYQRRIELSGKGCPDKGDRA